MIDTSSPSQQRWTAVGLFAIGLFLIYRGATNTPQSHAPTWLLYMLAVQFLAGGVALIKKAAGTLGKGTWFGLIFCVTTGIAFAWIPFSGHPEDCTSTFSFLFWRSKIRGDPICQGAFEMAGWFFIALAIVIVYRWARSTFGKPKSYY